MQGVNTQEDYVWANVTSFSYFVIGAPALTPSIGGGGGGGGGGMPYMN